MQRANRALVPAFITVFAAACGSVPQEASNTKLVNGQAIPLVQAPAVVQVTQDLGGGRTASCTATWISDSVLLTAAHCVEANKLTYIRQGSGEGAQSRQILRYPRYGTPATNRQDVALVIFPAGSSAHWLPVAQANARGGETVTILGFGLFHHGDWNSGGLKRIGTNTIDHLEYYEHSLVIMSRRQSIGDGTGVDVMNSQGDSGGPMILGGKVIGVSSTASDRASADGRYEGSYANVRQTEVWAWLQQVGSQGYRMYGVNQ